MGLKALFERPESLVTRYQNAEKELAAAKQAVADYILQRSGLMIGQLVRRGHNVYRVEGGNGYVNPHGEVNMVMVVRRTYKGGEPAMSRSTEWASSLSPLTPEESVAWMKPPPERPRA